MKKIETLNLIFFFFLIFQTLAGNNDHQYRKMIISKGDSTIHFSICNTSVSTKVKNNTFYFWYGENQIHYNKGAYGGRLIHGVVLTYDLQGRLVEQGNIQFGIKRGSWLKWHRNGEISQITKWSKGKISGIELYYNQKGQLILKKKYKNGKEVGKVKVFENGKRQREEKIKKPKKEKGQKKLKYEKFDENEKNGESKKDKGNRGFYQWIKNLFKNESNKTGESII